MTDEDILERYFKEEDFFTGRVVTNPITFQPIIHLTAQFTYELLLDMRSTDKVTEDQIALAIGKAALEAMHVDKLIKE